MRKYCGLVMLALMVCLVGGGLYSARELAPPPLPPSPKHPMPVAPPIPSRVVNVMPQVWDAPKKPTLPLRKRTVMPNILTPTIVSTGTPPATLGTMTEIFNADGILYLNACRTDGRTPSFVAKIHDETLGVGSNFRDAASPANLRIKINGGTYYLINGTDPIIGNAFWSSDGGGSVNSGGPPSALGMVPSFGNTVFRAELLFWAAYGDNWGSIPAITSAEIEFPITDNDVGAKGLDIIAMPNGNKSTNWGYGSAVAAWAAINGAAAYVPDGGGGGVVRKRVCVVLGT